MKKYFLPTTIAIIVLLMTGYDIFLIYKGCPVTPNNAIFFLVFTAVLFVGAVTIISLLVYFILKLNDNYEFRS